MSHLSRFVVGERAVLWLAIAVLAASLALGSNGARAADYTPPDPVPGYSTVGSGGALLENQGTALDMVDSAAAWNIWTGKSKLAAGSYGCGSLTSCVIFANEGSYLYYTYCAVPYTGSFAQTYQIGVNLSSADCLALVDPYPIFVVTVNNQSFNSTQKLHIARHEVAHAVGIDDAPTQSCWQEWGYWLPLLRNGGGTGCTAFPSNYTATYNEALYAVIRSGW